MVIWHANYTALGRYRHHYTEEEMDEAYPNACHFFERKQHFDPTCMFTSAWYERYGRRFWMPLSASSVQQAPAPALAEVTATELRREDVELVSEHRTNSYALLMSDRKMKADFRDLFLTRIFNVSTCMAFHRWRNCTFVNLWAYLSESSPMLILEYSLCTRWGMRIQIC